MFSISAQLRTVIRFRSVSSIVRLSISNVCNAGCNKKWTADVELVTRSLGISVSSPPCRARCGKRIQSKGENRVAFTASAPPANGVSEYYTVVTPWYRVDCTVGRACYKNFTTLAPIWE